MFGRLKKRWKISSNFQVLVILIVFAVTGSLTVYARKFIFDLIGITTETLLLLRVLFYILVILTVYNILLLIVGFIFGQFSFFWEFEKKFFSKFLARRKVKISEIKT